MLRLIDFQEWAANYWVQGGCPKNKLIIGMGTYGRGFTLTSASSSNVGDPAKGPAQAGPFTREAGFLAYYEVSSFFSCSSTLFQTFLAKSRVGGRNQSYRKKTSTDCLPLLPFSLTSSEFDSNDLAQRVFYSHYIRILDLHVYVTDKRKTF